MPTRTRCPFPFLRKKTPIVISPVFLPLSSSKRPRVWWRSPAASCFRWEGSFPRLAERSCPPLPPPRWGVASLRPNPSSRSQLTRVAPSAEALSLSSFTMSAFDSFEPAAGARGAPSPPRPEVYIKITKLNHLPKATRPLVPTSCTNLHRKHCLNKDKSWRARVRREGGAHERATPQAPQANVRQRTNVRLCTRFRREGGVPWGGALFRPLLSPHERRRHSVSHLVRIKGGGRIKWGGAHQAGAYQVGAPHPTPT